MVADALTKSLPSPAHIKHRDIMLDHVPFSFCESVTQVRSREEHRKRTADTHKVDVAMRPRATLSGHDGFSEIKFITQLRRVVLWNKTLSRSQEDRTLFP
jgi:hypothetical protein